MQILVTLFFIFVWLNSSAQPGSCELFANKKSVDKNKRLVELKGLEGDSILVQFLNKKGEVTKEEKGIVRNLASDIVRRGGLHTVLFLGEEKKNGKIDRSQYSTIALNLRIYRIDCEE